MGSLYVDQEVHNDPIVYKNDSFNRSHSSDYVSI